MTEHDTYVLEIIEKSGKTEFTQDDFKDLEPAIANRTIVGMKNRGILNFIDASADTKYSYLCVSVSKR